jgi:FAD/FMN-containing dehydrogenase
MIHPDDQAPQEWNGVHVTHKTTVAKLVNVDNVGPDGKLLTGFDMFRQAGASLDELIRQAREAGQRVLAIGSGWALSRVNITDGWLVNTKELNGCYDVAERHFHPSYPAGERRLVTLAQAGMQIAELNAFLELIPNDVSDKRALKAAGIGNGQTIAGAVSGNTHGSQLEFGAMPDFVVGLHLATGNGETLWIERASRPVFTDEFAQRIGARMIRDDEVFDAAVVSFGTFGIVAAMAVETAPVYQLAFPAIADVSYQALKAQLQAFADPQPTGLYHYEFIFDPHASNQMAMVASAQKVPYEPGHPTPQPRWIIRDKRGFAPGDMTLPTFSWLLRLLPAPLVNLISKDEFQEYRRLALLGNVRGTPGQLYTASIYYLEGYTESAFAVAVADAPQTIDIVSQIAGEIRLPSISQVRLVRASTATLGFTWHQPRTAVFEVAMVNDGTQPEFERRLDAAFRAAGIKYTMHWSKNAGIDPTKLEYMYGAERIARWRAAREAVFGNDDSLMKTFASDAALEAGLATR